MAAKRRKAAAKQDTSLRPLYIGGTVLVAGLAALVWWSLPGNHAPERVEEAEVVETATRTPTAEDAAPRAKNRFERPPRASAELAIITSKTEAEIHAIATATEIAKRLDARTCGSACDAIRKFMEDEDNFDVDSMTTEDLILPPRDTFDTVAAGLTPAERDAIASKPNAAVVHVTGNVDPNHLGARTAWATAAVLAEALDGVVYDETCRRIESKDEVFAHAITSKLGDPVFSPKQVVVQLYRQDEGTERMLSFGMLRFGARTS